MSQPAARVGDLHVCPMVSPGPVPHVGGPIIPPGAVNVLIGGLPAAKFGDKCICVGCPPAMIVKGSATVWINNKPAARMGDLTAHGGTITTGLPTVLIGDMGAAGAGVDTPCAIIAKIDRPPMTQEAAAEQLQLQKDLNDAVLMNLDSVPPNQRADALSDLAAYNEAVDTTNMGRLSEASYDENSYGECGKTPCGYKKVDPKDMSLTDEHLSDPSSGFHSAIYEDGDGNKVVAFRGTEMTSLKDWKTNGAQGSGMETDQYNSAMKLANDIKDSEGGGDVRFTGHSLGGGLASSANAVTGNKTTTFNAAGLHPNTSRNGPISVSPEMAEANAGNIDAYYNEHDILNGMQDNRHWLLGGLTVGAALLTPLVGPKPAILLGSLWATGAMSKAAGNRHELPSDDGPIEAHGMEKMMILLEKQEKENLEKLADNFGC